ncbi:MAG: hypothetical protein EZS28_033759 [Streblomastix strix]|uniref:Uncharacterized protein n=1 Tax=Streblomastix strix TaxID=222440 RepID=A0A5J4UKH6_9EUKA|nr:MAG: hypothetical protein EZS28_033759 [Streblomastix strix]
MATSIVKSPVCTFIQCEFIGNTGCMNNVVHLLDYPITIGFMQCNINSINIIYSSHLVNSYLNEIKSYSFGGYRGSASNESIYVSITGLIIGRDDSTNPLQSIKYAIYQKVQGRQSLLTLLIGQGTWEDDRLMIKARTISFDDVSVNKTLLVNKITSKTWLACVIGGILNIRNIGLRQASAPESFDGILPLRGDGTIELKQFI